MMKIFKRSLILIVFVLMFCFCGLFVACNDDSNDNGNGDDIETVQNSITLNEDSFNLKIGDVVHIVPTYDPEDGVYLVYTSSDANVASVDENGEIKALKVGSAVITATYGEISATCDVTVGLNGESPVIKTDVAEGASINVALSEKLDIKPWVYFNKVEYQDATFTYTFTDDSICTVENGVFTAKKLGSTDVTVSANWRGVTGITLTTSFKINVIADVELTVNGGAGGVIDVYTVASLGDNTFPVEKDFLITAVEKKNGSNQNLTPQIDITSGSDLIDIANNKVVSKGKGGVATIKVSCTDSAGATHEAFVTVNVLKSTADYNTTVEFSAMDGELPLTQIFGSDVILTEAVCEGEKLSLGADQKTVLGLTTSNQGAVNKTLTIYTDSVGYNVNVNAYTRIIDQASELKMFNFANVDHTSKVWDSRNVIDGYYVLGADIDCAGTLFYSQGFMEDKYAIGNSNLNAGFIGTFDGRGHTIKNLTFSASNITSADGRGSWAGGWGWTRFSLFGVLGANAEVKNVAITDVKYDLKVGYEVDGAGGLNAAGCGVIANFVMNSATIENVFIDVWGVTNSYYNETAKTATLVSGVAERIFDGATLRNIIIDFTLDSAAVEINQTGAISAGYTGTGVNYRFTSANNVYVISDNVLFYQNSMDASNTDAGIKVDNVKRYSTFTDMIIDRNDYTSFKSENGWVNTTETVFWNGLYRADNSVIQVGNYRGAEISLVASVNDTFDLSVYGITPTSTPTFSVVKGSSVSISGTTLTAKGIGTSTIKAQYEYEGNEYEITATLQVGPEVQAYATPIEFSAMHGDLPLSDIFGSNTTLTLAMQGDKVLTISPDGKRILDLTTTSNTEAETINITVYNSEKGYKLTLKAYAGILRTAEDLRVFNLGHTNYASNVETATPLGGYYVLGNDIDCTDATTGAVLYTHGLMNAIYDAGHKDSKYGFVGTFDGRGYTIKNLTFSAADITDATSRGNWNSATYSIFGVLGQNAVVKNVAITNVKYDLSNSSGSDMNMPHCSVLATYVMESATIDNVYIDVFGVVNGGAAMQTLADLSGVAERIFDGATLKNVVVDLTVDASAKTINKTASISASYTRSSATEFEADFRFTSAENVYVISDKVLFYSNTMDGNNTDATIKVENAYRYATAENFKSATATDNFASFTNTGYWSWDVTNGLAWKGVSAT